VQAVKGGKSATIRAHLTGKGALAGKTKTSSRFKSEEEKGGLSRIIKNNQGK